MSADIDSRLFLEVMEVNEGTVVTIRRREDIDAFEEVKTKEKQENTYCGKDADFYFTCMFHIDFYFLNDIIQQSGNRTLRAGSLAATCSRSVSAAV